MLSALLILAVVPYSQATAEPTTEGPSTQVAQTSAVQPVMGKDFRPAPQLSAEDAERMNDRLHAQREAMAAQVKPVEGQQDPNRRAPKTAASTAVAAQDPGIEHHGPPNAFIIGRNNQQTFGNTNTCGTNTTSPYEPAAANEGPHVYYTSNIRAQQFSLNGGTTWTCAAAYPAGPAAAPTAFGDTDVIYDHSRGVTFHMVLYVNAAITDGVIGIFVRRNINLADNCMYFIDLDPAATVIPDYPKLALSNDFVYTNANRVGGGWQGAMIARYSADQMSDCVTANGATINFTNAGGQRILVPGHGARDVMYFAWVNTTTQWRVFSWADSANTVPSTLINVGTMTFNDSDCRGGTNNVDWSSALNTSIVGFSVRTAIGNDFVHVWTAVSPDAGHTHAYVRGAMLRIGAAQDALTLVQQPEIWFGDRCAGLPNVGANDRGDQGLVVALGGATGGGGPAVDTGVAMKDQFNPGPGGFSFSLTAGSTHNPTRYGDYFTVRRQAPCGEFFAATGFGYVGGTALANTNARYVEFGRGRDNQCYLAWRNAVPAT